MSRIGRPGATPGVVTRCSLSSVVCLALVAACGSDASRAQTGDAGPASDASAADGSTTGQDGGDGGATDAGRRERDGSAGSGGSTSRDGGTGGNPSNPDSGGGDDGGNPPVMEGGRDGGVVCAPGDDRCVLPGTVDDFATCDALLPEIEGRSGEWYFYRGSGVACSPGSCQGVSVPPWGSDCAAWVAGGAAGTTDRFAGLGVGLNEPGPLYDACEYTSVEVSYGSDQAVQLFAKWNDIGAAGDRASVTLPATTGVGVQDIPLSSFTGMDCSALTELQFEPTSITAGFGIAVYNVRFKNAESVECIDTTRRCSPTGGLQICAEGTWANSSCAAGTACSDGRCIDDSATPVERHGHLRVSGTRLVNEQGVPVQLKGVSTHWLNYEDDGYATSRAALEWMRDNWDLSLLRVAMGVDVDGGYLDSASARADMLGQVEAAIDNAAATGVYLLVDWHSHAAHTQESEAVAFFADISERYGQLPNVLFETYNEPLAVSWAGTLKPYHEAVLEAIRGSDPDSEPNVVILGTPNWDQDVDAVIGNPVAGTNLMYTVHFYSCTHDAASGHLGVAQTALNAGVPIFVTEWGATDAAGGTGGTPVCAAAADGWHTWMNANRISSAAWKLDDCDFEVESTGTADTSCLLAKDAPVSGGWAASDLNGHGSYVVQQLRE